VLLNLVLNARDAMPDGGTLRIATAPLLVEEAYRQAHPWARTGEHVCLTIADTGQGMDQAALKRLFEPFFTTKKREEGTGLDLSMVYGLVKQHDGWIDVSSEPGRGACFSIFLPVHSSAGAEGTPTPSHNDIPRGVETILLAEDEEPVRTLTQRVLEGLGYTVLLARDGQEAVDTFAANQQRVDLLILDGVMPRLSGQKAYQAIQALGRPVPALFITGYSPDRLMVSADAGKGIWLLHKPFLPSDLARKVREALAGARPAQGQDRSGAGSTGHELA